MASITANSGFPNVSLRTLEWTLQRFSLLPRPSFLFAVLGMEPRALHVLGKCSTTEPHPQHGPLEVGLSFSASHFQPQMSDIDLRIKPGFLGTRHSPAGPVENQSPLLSNRLSPATPDALRTELTTNLGSNKNASMSIPTFQKELETNRNTYFTARL